jgi:transcriptional regulator with XRE-family HTH domain
MTPLEQLGRNIRAARKRCGMTQGNVAGELGISNHSVVCAWETARTSIPVMHLHALACCFGVTMDKFFEGITFEDEDAA